MAYTVLIFGSRDVQGNDFDWALDIVLEGLSKLDVAKDEVVLVCGRANGADQIAVELHKRFGYFWAGYAAEWSKYGRAAGPKRNERMLAESNPDVAIGFINKDLDQSRGSKHMFTIAKNAGVPTHLYDTRTRTQIA